MDSSAPDLTTVPDSLAAADPRVGAMLGSYRILERIGDGGMGQVYRAEHVHLERPAAIKFMLPHFAADEEAISRFLQEAKAVNRVRHPNLIDIYDYFVEPDMVAYVMELLDGRSLRDAILRETLGIARILPIAGQICGALHAVHAVGIVHRDLKPENVHLLSDPDGTDVVKILDFGVARFTRDQVAHRTQAGMTLGSPWYMAPEQARGGDVDHRADVYSLGVILYELLTGCLPFPGSTYAVVLGGHLTQAPPPLRRRDGWSPPSAIADFVLRCLEKDPDARPADMESAWRELAEAAGPQLAGACVILPGPGTGRTRRPSRVTLPLTASDPPIRLTPIEGVPEVAVTPAVRLVPEPRRGLLARAHRPWRAPVASSRFPRWGWIAAVALLALAGVATVASREERVAPAPVPGREKAERQAPGQGATARKAVAQKTAKAKAAKREARSRRLRRQSRNSER